MPKVDTSALIAGKRETFRYEYPSPPPIPGPFVFHVRPLNDVEEQAINGVAKPLFFRFVVGKWIDDKGVSHETKDQIWDAQGEEVVIPNWEPIEMAARIELMQNPPDENDRYTALEILRIMAAEPETYAAMMRDFVPHINGKGWKKKERSETTMKPSSEQSKPESDTPPKSLASTSGLSTSDDALTDSPANAA
jgi:hypothetical protein